MARTVGLRSSRLRLLVLCGFDPSSTFSYHTAWPRHFAAHPAFAATVVNLQDRRLPARARALGLVTAGRFDAIVLLHSVFSNAQLLDGWLLEFVQMHAAPKVFCIGNEYKLMPEKMTFAEALPARLLVTQAGSPAVQQLYRDRLGCAVTAIPNTGLDEALFRPRTPRAERPIDLGYRADDAPWYLGHRERRDIAEYFAAAASRHGLVVDISLDPSQRFNEIAWAAFLDRCKGQLGTEAGGDYFELDDHTRTAVNAYLNAHPHATFADVHEQFFAHYGPSVPIRIMSGRQVEAAGTATVQLLFEGGYDGVFHAGEHYIALRKDFSNADDALRQFADEAHANAIAARALTLVRETLSYPALLARYERAIAAVA